LERHFVNGTSKYQSHPPLLSVLPNPVYAREYQYLHHYSESNRQECSHTSVHLSEIRYINFVLSIILLYWCHVSLLSCHYRWLPISGICFWCMRSFIAYTLFVCVVYRRVLRVLWPIFQLPSTYVDSMISAFIQVTLIFTAYHHLPARIQ